MPLDPRVTQFINDNPQGVLTTYRRNGKAQMSIVTVRVHRDAVGVSITEDRAKFKNLLRNPECSILISSADWWSGFIVVDGTAELIWSGNTDPVELQHARREVYSATTRRRTADWAEYDRLVDADKRVAVIIQPQHMYGTFFNEKWPGARIAPGGK
jgi:PPOX class probable F420-dependent enzyme